MLNEYDKEILRKDEVIYNLNQKVEALENFKNQLLTEIENLKKENKKLHEEVHALIHDRPNVKSMRHF